MNRVRRTAGGLMVFPAMKTSDGPPAEWIAIAVDRRLPDNRCATGIGPTALEAEADAMAKLGATPRTIRVALAPDENG